MRDYARISPKFWIGPTGRQLRGYLEGQVVANYLMHGPQSTMLGLYYLPLPTLCHETGISLDGASKALRRLSELGFCDYDTASEWVWVREMARYQIGDMLSPNDKQVKGVHRQFSECLKGAFARAFFDRYRDAFHLYPFEGLLPDGVSPCEGTTLNQSYPSKPLARPFEGIGESDDIPFEASREVEKEQEQEKEQEKSGSKPKKPKTQYATVDDPTLGQPYPIKLDCPEFQETWLTWISYRNERKEPLTATTVKMQLKKCAEIGLQRAIRMIEHTIASTWIGLREPEHPKNMPPPPEERMPSFDEIQRMGWNPTTGLAGTE